MSGGSVQLALLRLLLAALRVRPEELSGPGISAEGLTGIISSALSIVRLLLHRTKDSIAPACDLSLRLLRAQALQAASRQLQAFTGALTPIAVVGQHEAQQQQQQQQQQERPGEHEEAGAWDSRVAETLANIGFAVFSVVLSMGQLCAGDILHHEQRTLYRELATALSESCVMEHAAWALLRLPMLLSHCTVRVRVAMNSALQLACLTRPLLADVCAVTKSESCLAAFAAQLVRVVSGRCMQTLTLSLGLATLCAADGGSAHGMPPVLLAALPLDLHDGDADSAAPGRPQLLDSDCLRAMLVALSVRGRVRPPGRRGALSLVMRVGRLAIASAQAAAGPSQLCAADGMGGGGRSSGSSSQPSGGSGSRTALPGDQRGGGGAVGSQGLMLAGASSAPGALPMVLAPSYIGMTCRSVLLAAKDLRLLHPQPGSAQWRAEAVEWWRLAVAAARHVQRHAQAGEPGRFGALLESLADEEPGQDSSHGVLALPAAPPPEVAAALESGFLPCLERLLRRAGQDLWGPEARVVRGLLGGDSNSMWRLLVRLLAYGDSRQAAALVATLGKLLRLIDPRVVMASDVALNEHTLWIFLCKAVALMGGQSPDGDGPGTPEAEPEDTPAGTNAQLARLLSYAACEWLPPLSRLALQGMKAMVRGHETRSGDTAGGSSDGSSSGSAGTRPAIFGSMVLMPVLAWLAVLAAQCDMHKDSPCVPCGGAAGDVDAARCGAAIGSGLGPSGAASGAADGSFEPGGNRGDWRSVLFEEASAVPLLGAALRVAAGAQGDDSVLSSAVAAGCRAVAAVGMRPEDTASRANAAHGPPAMAGDQRVGAADSLAGGGAPSGLPGCSGGTGGALCSGVVQGGGGAGSADVGLAPSPPPWQPELLRCLAARLRAAGQANSPACAEAVADWLEQRWGLGSKGGEQPVHVLPPLPVAFGSLLSAHQLALSRVLVPPAEARLLLRTCANPHCVNLAGDSEAELPLKACAGCGAVGYCGRDCQTAHWRVGHKEECKGRAGGGYSPVGMVIKHVMARGGRTG